MRRIRISFVLMWTVVVLAHPEPDALAQTYRAAEMNTEQLRALDREKTVVLLPGGILEEHGPYAPSFNDGYMNERLTRDLADAIVARPGWKVLIFPLIPLGTDGANYIGGKQVFPGSYTIRSSTLRAVFMDLATVLGEQGFRWIFIVHMHGAPNHHRALDQAADYFNDSYSGHMVHLNGLRYVMQAWEKAQEYLTEEEQQENGVVNHASAAEQSVTLFLRPDLVPATYRSAPSYTGNTIEEIVQLAQAEDWPGYFGAPRLATADIGAQTWKAISSRWIEVALKILDGQDYREMQRWGDLAETLPAWAAIDKAALEYEERREAKQREWLKKRGLK